MTGLTKFILASSVSKSLATASVALLTFLAAPALAQDPYVELEAGASVLKLPSNLFFAERGETSPFARLGDLDTDSGILIGTDLSLTLGTELAAPLFDADSSTIEFTGGFQNAWGSSSASFLDTGPGIRYGWVEMPYVGGWGTSDGFTLATTTDRSARYIDMQVLLKNKYEQAELFFGPDIRILDQTLTMNGEIVGGTATVNLVEDLSTVYAGVTLGASFDVVSTDDWLVNILGAVSILGDSTQYDSTYVDILRTQTNSLTDSQIAVGALAKVTVQKQIAPNTTLGGYATIDYLSHSPQIKYGSSPGDPADPVFHIAGAPMFGGSVGLTFRRELD